LLTAGPHQQQPASKACQPTGEWRHTASSSGGQFGDDTVGERRHSGTCIRPPQRPHQSPTVLLTPLLQFGTDRICSSDQTGDSIRETYSYGAKSRGYSASARMRMLRAELRSRWQTNLHMYRTEPLRPYTPTHPIRVRQQLAVDHVRSRRRISGPTMALVAPVNPTASDLSMSTTPTTHLRRPGLRQNQHTVRRPPHAAVLLAHAAVVAPHSAVLASGIQQA
jgi:hypothetical protein